MKKIQITLCALFIFTPLLSAGVNSKRPRESSCSRICATTRSLFKYCIAKVYPPEQQPQKICIIDNLMKHPDFARVKLEKMSSDHEEKGTPSRTLSLAMNSIQFRLTAESVLSTVRSETDPQHHINIFSKGILAEALRRLDGTQRRMWRIAALSQSQKKVDQQLEFLKKKVVEECIRDRNAATIERVVKFGTELETIERVGKMFNTDSQLFTNPLAEYQFLFNS